MRSWGASALVRVGIFAPAEGIAFVSQKGNVKSSLGVMLLASKAMGLLCSIEQLGWSASHTNSQSVGRERRCQYSTIMIVWHNVVDSLLFDWVHYYRRHGIVWGCWEFMVDCWSMQGLHLFLQLCDWLHIEKVWVEGQNMIRMWAIRWIPAHIPQSSV